MFFMSPVSSRDPESEEALFPRRIVSFILDSMVIQFISLVIVNTRIGLEIPYMYETRFEDTDYSVYYFSALWLVYLWIFDFLTRGRALGKYTFKLRVVQQNGSPLPRHKHAIRTLVKMLSVPLVIPVLYFAWNKAALHDKLFKTKTVNVPSRDDR